MSQWNIRNIAGALLCVSGLVAVSTSAHADGSPREAAKSNSTLNLAGLTAVLQAASDRKQSGAEVTLKKDVLLHDRPIGAASEGGILHAGTVVRKSKRQIVNSSGSWRHVETREGLDGWLSELDLDPDD